jgi:hypothetical protein
LSGIGDVFKILFLGDLIILMIGHYVLNIIIPTDPSSIYFWTLSLAIDIKYDVLSIYLKFVPSQGVSTMFRNNINVNKLFTTIRGNASLSTSVVYWLLEMDTKND